MTLSIYASLGLGLSNPLSIILSLIFLAIAIFEIFMFIHAIRNKFIDTNRKLLWILGMIIIHPFVAIAYFVIDYNKAG